MIKIITAREIRNKKHGQFLELCNLTCGPCIPSNIINIKSVIGSSAMKSTKYNHM